MVRPRVVERRLLPISLAVVGADYPNKNGPGRRFEIALCKPGEPVELRREPKNEADPRAVAVYSVRGVQLGYLSAERAPRIGAMILNERELRAIFQASSDWGAWIRVAFDGDEPNLPPTIAARPTARLDEAIDPDPPFYPDDIPDYD